MSAQADGVLPAGRFDRWIGPIGAGLAVIGLLVLGAACAVWAGRSPGWAYDFGAYFEAAQRLVASGSPYQLETLAGPFRPGPYGLYLYAPPLAIAFVPLTVIGTSAGATIWLVARIVLLGLTCAVMPISRPLRLAIFGIAALSAPVLFDLDLGNVSLLVTFLSVVVWRWLDKPGSGIALALSLTMRPTMGLIAVWWLVRGVWRPVLWMIGTGLVIVAVTLPIVGLGGWFDYVTVLRNVSDVTGVRRNVDLGSAVLMFGGASWLASGALLSGYAISIAAIVLSLRRDRELSYVVTVMATLLLAPLLWDHYLTNLLVPAAFLASRGKLWGLLLPLLCWIPSILVAVHPSFMGRADGLLPFIVLVGLVLPFLAPNRGAPAGFVWQRLAEWRSIRVARA